MTVATITSQIRGLDAEVFLDESDGLSQPCVVNLDTLSTIYRSDLRERVATLSTPKMHAVEEAIHHALGMPIPCRLAD